MASDFCSCAASPSLFNPKEVEDIRRLGGIFDITDGHYDTQRLRDWYYNMSRSATAVTASSPWLAEYIEDKTGVEAIYVPDPYEFPERAFEWHGGQSVMWFGSNPNFRTLRGIELDCPLEIITGCNEPGSKLNVKMIPYSRQAMLDGFARHDIVIIPVAKLPRKYVNNANRAINAIRQGKLVVGHDIPSHRELEDYIIVADDILGGIMWARQHPANARAMVEAGQDYIRDRFSPEAALDTPPIPDQAGNQFIQVPVLAPSETYTWQTSYAYSGAGDFNMYAFVDSFSEMAESIDDNNVYGPYGIHVANSALLPRTGQNVSDLPGDDGALQMGSAWPNPRFTDNGNGTVTDNLTGLIWLKDANCSSFFAPLSWSAALSACNGLSAGYCGLTDGSSAGDWRLPNRNELNSLVAIRYGEPALCNTSGTGQWTSGNPFTNVESSNYYWSSTSFAVISAAWRVGMGAGDVYISG